MSASLQWATASSTAVGSSAAGEEKGLCRWAEGVAGLDVGTVQRAYWARSSRDGGGTGQECIYSPPTSEVGGWEVRLDDSPVNLWSWPKNHTGPGLRPGNPISATSPHLHPLAFPGYRRSFCGNHVPRSFRTRTDVATRFTILLQNTRTKLVYMSSSLSCIPPAHRDPRRRVPIRFAVQPLVRSLTHHRTTPGTVHPCYLFSCHFPNDKHVWPGL